MQLLQIRVLVLLLCSAASGCSSVAIEDMVERYDGPLRHKTFVVGSVDSTLTGPLLPDWPGNQVYTVGEEPQMFSSTVPGPLTR